MIEEEKEKIEKKKPDKSNDSQSGTISEFAFLDKREDEQILHARKVYMNKY